MTGDQRERGIAEAEDRTGSRRRPDRRAGRRPFGADIRVALARAVLLRKRANGVGRKQPRQRPHRHRPHERRSVAEQPLAPRARARALAEFPMAIRTLRTKRSRPVRLTGVPEKRARKAASSRRARSARGGAARSSRWRSFASRPACANLFQGQTARQSSQPKTRLPMAARRSAGMWPLCSMVRYEMQRRASS